MALHGVDLPDPARLRGRWAAVAAIYAARGWPDSCRAVGPVWHYDDGGGNWLRLHHVDQDRAVLVGHDHEYSETYFGPAADYFGEPKTDLLADAPSWWAPPVERAMAADLWVGFVYGYAGGTWSRADYTAQDGFSSVGLPALSDERAHEHIAGFAVDAPGITGTPDPAAIAALIAADGQVDEALVAAVIGSTGWSAAAGAAAARAFLPA